MYNAGNYFYFMMNSIVFNYVKDGVPKHTGKFGLLVLLNKVLGKPYIFSLIVILRVLLRVPCPDCNIVESGVCRL
jgi:hypothetical protein